MRYAIYFTPERDDALGSVAARWLGRDARTGETFPASAVGAMAPAEIAFHTAAARRYGFHATLKAPFRLADGETESGLLAALDEFAEASAPVTIPRIVVRQLAGFFAIVPETRSEPLDRLAAGIVAAFDRFRAPMSAAEIDRRNPDGLNPLQLRYLHQWGYPYVFDEFRFHMTLTGRVAANESARVADAIETYFGPLLHEPLEIAAIALFVEPEPGAPFDLRSFHSLGEVPARKTA